MTFFIRSLKQLPWSDNEIFRYRRESLPTGFGVYIEPVWNSLRLQSRTIIGSREIEHPIYYAQSLAAVSGFELALTPTCVCCWFQPVKSFSARAGNLHCINKLCRESVSSWSLCARRISQRCAFLMLTSLAQILCAINAPQHLVFFLCFLQKFVFGCNLTDNTSNIKIDHFVIVSTNTNTNTV